jgi:hypothetical protein
MILKLEVFPVLLAAGKGGVRGKNEKHYHASTNLVLLNPNVRKTFRSERAVEDALRLVIELRKVGSYKRRDYSSSGA